MSHIHASTSTLGRATTAPSGLSTLTAEVGALLGALLSPGAMVREVEAMGKVLREAHRVEGRDPARAEALRRRAARMVQ